MNKAVLTFLTILCLLSTVFLIGCKMARATSITLHVPADYPTIQAAINNARDGDTIQVSRGTYRENVVVNKTISLIGEDRSSTIIDGANVSDTIRITANNVTISGLTATNSNSTDAFSGISLGNARNSIISGNNVSGNNGFGISMFWGYNNSIVNDIITNNGMDGIRIDGINASSQVVNNTIESNQIDGIFLYVASDVLIENNVILSNNHTGISPQGGCVDITIRSNLVADNGWSDNKWSGLFSIALNNSLVEGNFFAGNGFAGIELGAGSNESVVDGNALLYNKCGVAMWGGSSSNEFYHNSFYKNTQQVSNNGMYPNTWDGGYPSGGNYWSDYNGTDSHSGRYQNETGHDWIGDVPYAIDANNTDNYPLIASFFTSSSVVSDYASLLGNSNSLNSTYNKLMSDFNSLQSSYNQLNSTYNKQQNDLTTVTNTMYALIGTTVIFIATTVFFARRRWKTKPEK